MAAIIPTWFDASYLQNILRNTEADESIEILNLIVKPATQKGDNYSSDIYRAAVEFTRVRSGDEIAEEISLIVKILPYNDEREEIIQKIGVFDTELSMLSKTLPKMNELISSLAYTPLAPRCLHISNEKPVHVIIDDLLPKGFRLAERRLGLDLDHSLIAIRNLARFHAASIALKEKEPAILEDYKKGVYHVGQHSAFSKSFKLSVISLAQEVANWPELDPRIADKLVKLAEVVYEKGCEASLYHEDDFIVLNHGDSWINNMMFRYDEQEKPIDHIFLDFQISHWGHPTDDILYFFGGSLSYEVRFDNRELLIREYHSSLTNTMSELQCATEAPSFYEIKDILKKKAFHELLACMFLLPIVTLEKDKSIDFVELLKNEEEFKNPGHRGKLFRKIMGKALPSFDDMGLLDV